MANIKVGRRLKPNVAFENSANAVKNIEAKIELIRILLAPEASLLGSAANASGYPLKTLLPKSIRQFNLWASTDLVLPTGITISFTRNSNQTLRSHKNLHIAASDCIKAVNSALEQEKPKQPSRDERIATHKRKVALANAMRDIAESEIIALKLKVKELEEDVARLKKNNHDLNMKLRNKK